MKDPSDPVCRTISNLLARIGDKWTVLVVQTLGRGPAGVSTSFGARSRACRSGC